MTAVLKAVEPIFAAPSPTVAPKKDGLAGLAKSPGHWAVNLEGADRDFGYDSGSCPSCGP